MSLVGACVEHPVHMKVPSTKQQIPILGGIRKTSSRVPVAVFYWFTEAQFVEPILKDFLESMHSFGYYALITKQCRITIFRPRHNY